MHSLNRANLRALLSIATPASLLLVAACSGGSIPSSAIPSAPLSDTVARAGAPASKFAPAKKFVFTTLDNQADPTFNQLLGINDHGVIAGYFGIGSPTHPNKGYTIVPPYGQANYTNENFPGSVQTQVTAIDNKGNTAGFWVDSKMVNRGFVEWNNVFTSFRDPRTGHGTVNQILGLNDSGIAVGFYIDGNGISHGFVLNQATGKFTALVPPGGGSVVASAINDKGDIAGFITSSTGSTNSFLKTGTKFSALSFPGGSNTQALGVNDKDQIVGSYLDGSGVMHGFLLTNPLTHARWTSIDDPNGVGSTVVNGLNDDGDLVGFYTDAAGNTDGMLATP
jgi:hypothetical protein